MRTITSCFAAAALAAVVVASAGCGGSRAAATAKVSGKVTLDGNPLSAGTITFDRTDGSPPTVINIKDGTYQGGVPVGKQTVRVSVMKEFPPEKGKSGPGYDQPQIKETIAPRFNTESRDVRDVTESGPNEINVAVTKQ